MNELSHITDMIVMQNQILGEQFKGLNDSFTHLISKKSSEAILSEEFQLITKNTKVLAERFIEQEKRITLLSNENASLWSDLKEMQSMNSDLRSQIQKLTSKVKEKLRYMSDEINSLKQEKSNLCLLNDSSEKTIKGLNEEIDHLKTKLKQLRQKKNLDSDTSEEKLCQKCKKMYKDSENFNWSCKVHLSTYDNDFWWCCGKKGENAIGCQASKHESRDEDSETLKEEELIRGVMICSVIFI
jgi:chromosome segregation ATPase